MRYDHIGDGYAIGRRSDPQIAAAIQQHLLPGQLTLNIGAGTGSYEFPEYAPTIALEPSDTMVAQRTGNVPIVRGVAEQLPFSASSFGLATCTMTIQHWADLPRACHEIVRVVRERVIFFSYFVGKGNEFWLTRDYFPELDAFNDDRYPTVAELEHCMGRQPTAIDRVPVPANCRDGLFDAYWARPAAYLDPHVRARSSSMRELERFPEGLERLRIDLASGAWKERNTDILSEDSLDLGYRVARFDLG